MKPNIRQGLRRLAIALTVAVGVPWVGVNLWAVGLTDTVRWAFETPSSEEATEARAFLLFNDLNTKGVERGNYTEEEQAADRFYAKKRAEQIARERTEKIRDARRVLRFQLVWLFFPPFALFSLIYGGGLCIAWVIDGFRSHPTASE